MAFNVKKIKASKVKKDVFKSIEVLHEEKMKSFKNPGDEYSYFLEVSDILQDYHDTPEDDFEKKREITQRYYKALDMRYDYDIVQENCNFCDKCKIEKTLSKEHFYTCSSCGVVDNEKVLNGLNYQDECLLNQTLVFDYKRINYFTEWITQIQANETTEIPHELLEDIKIELRKRNIIDTSKLSIPKVKKILKELDNTKYYEHIPLIISKLSNSKPLYIPDDLCCELKNMFSLIQYPFEILKGNRKNFLSYPYILYKFCEILGLREYMDHFTLLKSREKLLKTDVLWKAIVEEVYKTTGDQKWVFIPSC